MVFQIKQLLEDRGIPCFVKNEFAIGAMGELSPMDVMPEVWLSDAEWLPKAKQFIDELTAQQSATATWVCAKCQEKNAGNFELCWQCGTDKLV